LNAVRYLQTDPADVPRETTHEPKKHRHHPSLASVSIVRR
jgi:hypothetical protein